LAHRETEEPSHALSYESAERNIAAESYCGIACRQASAKISTFSVTDPRRVARDRWFESHFPSSGQSVSRTDLAVAVEKPGFSGRYARLRSRRGRALALLSLTTIGALGWFVLQRQSAL